MASTVWPGTDRVVNLPREASVQCLEQQQPTVTGDLVVVVAVQVERVLVLIAADDPHQQLLARRHARRAVVGLVRQPVDKGLRQVVGRGAAVDEPVDRQAFGGIDLAEPVLLGELVNARIHRGEQEEHLVVEKAVCVVVGVAVAVEVRPEGRTMMAPSRPISIWSSGSVPDCCTCRFRARTR